MYGRGCSYVIDYVHVLLEASVVPGLNLWG